MDIQDLSREILSSIKTREDADSIYRAYKSALDMLDTKAAYSFRVGQKISFGTKSLREPIEGIITKINKKTIKVHTSQGDWSVSPSFLKACD